MKYAFPSMIAWNLTGSYMFNIKSLRIMICHILETKLLGVGTVFRCFSWRKQEALDVFGFTADFHKKGTKLSVTVHTKHVEVTSGGYFFVLALIVIWGKIQSIFVHTSVCRADIKLSSILLRWFCCQLVFWWSWTNEDQHLVWSWLDSLK